MAVTADRDTDKRFSHAPRYARGVVQAGTAVYRGAMVCIDTTTGYVVNATDAANRRFFGVAKDSVAATATTDTTIEIYQDGLFHLLSTTGALTDHLAPAYLTDNETVENVSANLICVGAFSFVDNAGTSAWIDVSMAAQLTANSTAITFADGGAYVHETALAAANVDAAIEELHGDLEAHIMEDGAGGANDPDGTLANMEHNARAVAGHGTGLSYYVLDSGAGIAAETVVCPNGITGGIPDVIQSVGTTGAPPANFYCPDAIGAGANGWAFKYYVDAATGLNTGAAAAQDPVFRSATGTMTLTRPTGANQYQCIGRVLTAGANGDIFIDMTEGINYAQHAHTDESQGGLMAFTLTFSEQDEATGWVKNGTAQACPGNDVELPCDVTVIYAFATLQTVSGHAGGIAVRLNTSALFTIAQNAHFAQSLALTIPVAANTDFDIDCNENVAGAGAGLRIEFVYTVDAY